MTTTRTVHFVTSTHWDREWYDTFQGYRARLVSMLDEVVEVADAVPGFRFFMDGQTIPLDDWLAIRPERAADLKRLADEGRFTAGPWYVMPDEFIPAGESLVRNLELGRQRAAALGVPCSGAGFVCDIFGHTGQLPQILAQHGCHSAYIWRGVDESSSGANPRWEGADGTAIACYRFGWNGYCSTYCDSRDPKLGEVTVAARATRLAAHVRKEAARVGDPTLPLLAFDGGDHMEIDAAIGAVVEQANRELAGDGLRIAFSDLEAYGRELAAQGGRLARTISGELREPGAQRSGDNQWLIPGVVSSRIRHKQANAACEDALLLWAEPLAAAATAAGHRTLPGYLDQAWKHLLENHPHDSICGCSIDQVHRDMVYRFDQCRALAEGVAGRAMGAIARAAAPADLGPERLLLAVFNPTAEDLDEPLDLEIPLPTTWPGRFQEFFGYEERFSFALLDADGREVPWQLCGQQRDHGGRYRRPRYAWPTGERRHLLAVTAHLRVPAFGHATLVVESRQAYTRHPGSLVAGTRALDNGVLRVEVGADGAIRLTDQRSGRSFADLLSVEDHADIGDGWFHGQAVNDQVFTAAGAPCQVSVLHDGPEKATLAVETTLSLPEEFDFRLMRRSERRRTLTLRSELTLRRGGERVEVEITCDNQVRDHRLRVLFPTGLTGASMWQDQAFDVAERAVAFRPGFAERRELEVEGRPQQSWTAYGDGRHGLALVARGIPECAVIDRPDRPLALTLLRGFRRTVMQDLDAGVDSQELGAQRFRLWLVPFAGEVPRARLCRLGQRVARPLAQVELDAADLADAAPGSLPRRAGFLGLAGEVVATSLRRGEDGWTRLRLFNPTTGPQPVRITPAQAPAAVRHERLDGAPGAEAAVLQDGVITITLPAKRIATIAWR
ncbi:MAG: glycoside hydrolase family 38 [Planctomycetes bacterium]|nr:glycoside hydrolase family 38 [Planctomycetota bacterium]